MTKLSALLYIVVQIGLHISKTYVSAQSTTPPTNVQQSEVINQTDLSNTNQPTAGTTTISSPVWENVTSMTSFLTTEPSASSTTENPEPENDYVKLDHDLFLCTCDLIGGQCDVNCCCDPECSLDDRRLFSRCWSPPSSYFDRYYCSPDPDRYGLAWNNTLEYRVEWSVRRGMFCIVTDNVPKKRMFEDKPPLAEDEVFQHILPKLSGRWNVPGPMIELDQWIYQPFYKEGSPLFTLHVSGTIGVLKLPHSLNSAMCNIAKEVTFLQSDDHYQCILPGKDQCNPNMRLEQWLSRLAVFRLPSHSASAGNSNSSIRWGDTDKLAPVIIRICDPNSGCRSDLPAPEPSCQNSLTAVTLRISYNGTEGIRSVLVDLLYTAGKTGSVRFRTIHQSLSEIQNGGGSHSVRMRSGNPGYLNGKPVLAAKLNSSRSEGAFQRLDVFPGTPRSRVIRFGEDSYHSIRVSSPNVENRTELCDKWRQFVLESLWGPDFELLRLGAFGNVELNETEFSGLWLPVRIQSDELVCFKSLIQAELVIVYTRSGSHDQPQNKLVGAGMQLRSSGAEYCVAESASCSLLLSQTVSFVMADSPTFMILPQPPRWRIQLPYDFFYPFLLSSCASSTSPLTFFIVISTLCFIIDRWRLMSEWK
ncbi:tectonic-1-like [Daphnia carinata]|uniref:tectonic-1-like n=1 Tax=Daphnia carinata TaxID=120202 RepID=UPI00257D6CD4|nr:tectonic-1-like [Daphnia carinata]